MCRLSFIMIVGALVLSTNLHRAESFSIHRIHDKDSHEHLELVDSNELQETGTTKSDEQIDSEENRIVKRHVIQPDHSTEEESPKSLDSHSDEHDDDVVLVKMVKRNTESVDHSSEENKTAVETTTIDHSSEEETTKVDDDSVERKIVKREVPVESVMVTIVHHHESSEEDLYSQSDEHDSDEKRIVKRDVQASSEEDVTTAVYSDEHSEEDKIVKRDAQKILEDEKTSVDLLDSQSVENDDVDSEEKKIVKRSIAVLSVTVDHSSEESTTDSPLDNSVEDSLEDVLARLPLEVESLPSTALRI